MAVERELWRRRFSRTNIPHFVCPRCGKGRLTLVKGSLVVKEPAFSAKAHGHADWEPEWITERFIFSMACGIPSCGEIVSVSGETMVEEVEDEEHGWALESMLYPRAIYPAPPIFSVPHKLPSSVEKELSLAFQLFWTDLDACSSRLRTSVERVLDDLKIPRRRRSKKGKLRWMSLQERIEAFEAKIKDDALADTFNALRVVGNLGTHEGGVDRDALLDASLIYEDALNHLYGATKKELNRIRKALLKSRGRYKTK